MSNCSAVSPRHSSRAHGSHPCFAGCACRRLNGSKHLMRSAWLIRTEASPLGRVIVWRLSNTVDPGGSRLMCSLFMNRSGSVTFGRSGQGAPFESSTDTKLSSGGGLLCQRHWMRFAVDRCSSKSRKDLPKISSIRRSGTSSPGPTKESSATWVGCRDRCIARMCARHVACAMQATLSGSLARIADHRSGS
eukprot:6273007-Prymnesium_polylepis.1